MREILFKAKRLDNGEWVGGDFSGKPNGVSYICPDRINWWIKVDPSTVCRYTGLKDKNGVRIFEGDILAFTDCEGEEFEYTVIWNDDLSGFMARENELGAWDVLDEVFRENARVIGNIHDKEE